jgi:hypothetical protein
MLGPDPYQINPDPQPWLPVLCSPVLRIRMVYVICPDPTFHIYLAPGSNSFLCKFLTDSFHQEIALKCQMKLYEQKSDICRNSPH